MKRGLFSLRRLRWKLTLSYTLVTVVALLIAELMLVGVLLAFLNSSLPPRLLVGELAGVAARLEPQLAQTPPDTEGVREDLRPFTGEVGVATDVRGTESGSGVEIFTDMRSGEGGLFVLDDERRMIGAVPDIGELPDEGSFDVGSIPGLSSLVTAALDGEEDPGRLSARTPEGQMLAVAPIKSDDGRVLGVVVATFRMPGVTGTLLVILAASVVALALPAALLGAIFGFLTAWGLTRRLQRLARAAQAWSLGDFSVTTKDRSQDEIGQLSRELNSMAAQLESLIQTRGELATLEARNRFARDLHDSVKQQVFATSLQVAAARALIEQDTKAAESHLAQADELVRQAQKELNVLIQEMRPAALEGKGLAAALRDYSADWSRRSEVQIDVHVRGERETPLDVEQALFRVAQEALANVAKHSGAKNAEVDLVYDADNLTLRVADDGRGFDPAKNPGDGFGLQSMHERLVRLGGHINIVSAPGKGTQVVCVCPLDGGFPKKGTRA